MTRSSWSGWVAAVPVVVLATIAVLATPHTRGIGFQPALRYAVTAPVIVGIAVGAAFLYRELAGRVERPRTALVAALSGGAVLVWVGMAAVGPSGLACAAVPVGAVVVAGLGWWVPRFVDRPRSWVGGAVWCGLGVLEALVLVGALSSERGREPAWDIEHHFVDLPGGARVHYVDEGEGEVLLFLHGNPSWSYQWRDLIAGLSGEYRCVALDYPGFGLSDAPPGFGYTAAEESRVVEAFVDRLGLRDVTLVMQDWGGPIGLGLAERRPELVRGLILGSTWAWPTATDEPRGMFSVIVGGPIGEFVQMNFNGFVSMGIDNGIVRELPAEVLETYTAPFRPVDRRGVAAFYPGQITAATAYFAELEAGLAGLRDQEVLIFWALRDRGFPRTDLVRFEAAFPNHRTIELPEADHFFFEDSVAEMIPEIRAFLSRGR